VYYYEQASTKHTSSVTVAQIYSSMVTLFKESFFSYRIKLVIWPE